MANKTFFVFFSSQTLQSYFHNFLLQTIKYFACLLSHRHQVPLYVHIFYIAIPLACLIRPGSHTSGFFFMSLSTYLAIIFTLCNCKLAPAIPNSCICNKGSGWKTPSCCNFKWRCLSGESQERKKKSHKHSDKMTQAFQTSAIIEVEHKTVSFVLPVDHALAAALLPLCLSPGVWQHQPWTAEMCLSECWVWQTYVLCLLSQRCFQVKE